MILTKQQLKFDYFNKNITFSWIIPIFQRCFVENIYVCTKTAQRYLNQTFVLDRPWIELWRRKVPFTTSLIYGPTCTCIIKFAEKGLELFVPLWYVLLAVWIILGKWITFFSNVQIKIWNILWNVLQLVKV